MLVTIAPEMPNSLASMLDNLQAIFLYGFPGAEDDELLDEIVKILQTKEEIKTVQINLREYPDVRFLDIASAIMDQLRRDIDPLKHEAVLERDPLRTIRKIFQEIAENNVKVILVIRKIHYSYFRKARELRYLIETNLIGVIISTYISPSILFSHSGYGSPFHQAFQSIHLSPIVRQENYSTFLANICNDLELNEDDRRLLSLAGRNKALIAYCGNIIREHHLFREKNFDSALRSYYDLCRGYFGSAWECLDEAEKAMLLTLAVNWVKNPDKTKSVKLPKDSNIFDRTITLTRLVEYEFITVKNAGANICSPLFAYWIVIDCANVVSETFQNLQDTRHTWIKNAANKALAYIDNNKDFITKIAFDVLKGVQP